LKILSIDGGGIRGVFPAHILRCISTRLEINLHEHFDMIAGTSTGAIIAAAVACEIDPDKIISLYREYGELIFARKTPWWPRKFGTEPVVHSVYDSDSLRKVLRDIFGERKLGEILKPLLLPATDIGNGCVHVFKSGYSKNFMRDKDVYVRDAVAASCSAPTFFDPTKVNEYLLADGGLWANNPSLAAVIDAKRRLKIDFSEIKILSLGTGHAKTCYGVQNDKKWGFATGWKGKEFISFIMSLQAQSTNNYLELMLEEGQMLRLNFESDQQLPLDDCSTVDDLISRADRVFTYCTPKIEAFFNFT
jgi:uncharacterized protein